MRKLLTLVSIYTLLGGLSGSLFAQTSLLESRYWYFGDQAGLRFRAGHDSLELPPVALGDASTEFDAGEGSTTISNLRGRLLFYTGTRTGNFNYSTAYNRNHQRMLNGDSLEGGSSSTQNALIVRQPGNTPNYIIFQVAQHENYGTTRGTGFYYSVVDTSLDNGLGGVIPGQKNVLIIDSIAEKVSAVLHRNGRDVWVLSHRYRSNQFVSVRVSAAGVSQPVITPIGIQHEWARGALKLSPNGNRVVCALTEAQSGRQYIQVGRFDNLTGDVFDVFHIPLTGTGFGPFGVEFSPDNSKLYVGDRNTNRIYQYDLCAGEDSTDIIASRYDINPGFEPGGVQLGLDGRIYVSRVAGPTAGFISAITAPNESGAACGFQASFIRLAAGTSADRGLTNVNQSIFNDLAGTLEYTRLCERDTVQFHGEAACQGVIAKYYWNFGDPASGDLNIDSVQDPKHFYATPGTYRVRLRAVVGNQEDTVSEMITITPLANVSVIYDSLACKQTYRYSSEQDTSGGRNVPITNYRWKVYGQIDGQTDSTYEGVGMRDIEITWDSNQVARFALYAETQTSLGEVCVSDSFPFRVIVNQRRGATPTGPDTLCFDPEVPFVISSSDSPRSNFQWVFTPNTDQANIEGQGTSQVNVFVTRDGLKTIKTAFFLDTLNMICYTESAPFRFYAAAAPADSIYIWGDSSICENPTAIFLAAGREPTSTVRWNFSRTMPGGNASFLTDSVGDSLRVTFANLSTGRNQYFLEAQEVSKDGCLGPITQKEIWNACIEYPNIVTPGADNLNDQFRISNGANFPDSEITIYNRWGKRVYKGNASNNPNMSDLAPGVYFYKIRVFWEGRDVERSGWFEVAK